jgi:hypothetical protein
MYRSCTDRASWWAGTWHTAFMVVHPNKLDPSLLRQPSHL